MRASAASGVHQASRTRGYTLIELMIVLAIVALLATAALPGFARLIASSALSANVNALVATFELARSEAVSRNTLVVVCRATGLALAVPACSAAAQGNIVASDWAAGWIVFEKPQGSDVLTGFDPATDRLIRRIAPESVRAVGERTLILPQPETAMVGWAGDGLRLGGGAQAPVFVFDHRLPASATPSVLARCVLLSIVGRARAGAFDAGACNV